MIIAESDPALRRLLDALLSPSSDMRVVGRVSDAERMVSAVQRLKPDVVLVDGAMAGATHIARIATACERTRVVVLGTYMNGAMDALAAGARDFILKDDGPEGIANAIRRVSALP